MFKKDMSVFPSSKYFKVQQSKLITMEEKNGKQFIFPAVGTQQNELWDNQLMELCSHQNDLRIFNNQENTYDRMFKYMLVYAYMMTYIDIYQNPKEFITHS